MFFRRAVRVNLIALGLLLASGCEVATNASREETVKNFAQKLVLQVDGQSVELPLEKLDVFLTEEEEYPEIFELLGPGVALVGEFPVGVRVDYGEHWDLLVGKAIPIAAKGGDPRAEKTSSITLPGKPAANVVGGTFTVEKFDAGWDAKTPLTGRIELQLATPDGEKTIRGTFAVLGTTWG
jgi:hypothetical protein